MLAFIPAEANFTAVQMLYTYSRPESCVLKYNTAFHTHDCTECKYGEEFILKGIYETENCKQQQNKTNFSFNRRTNAELQ